MKTLVIRHCREAATSFVIAAAAFAAAPAHARLGYDADDPIRTIDIHGEYTYLARLRGADGGAVHADRRGSTFVDGFESPMDVWGLSCGTNEATLYLYGYGPTNTLAAPEGFVLVPEEEIVYAEDGGRSRHRRPAPKREPIPPPAPGEWPGLGDKAALAAWSECVRTNGNAFTSARFRDEQLLPLLRREALEPLLAGPDADAAWFAEATNYVAHELWLCWYSSMTDRPNPDWGRAYDFTVKEGSKDPFLSWMSVHGQHKWHWDDNARKQLAGMEEAAAAAGTPFQRFLAAHARNELDPSPERAEAARAAAAAWAAACAPAESRAVHKVLEQFFSDEGAELARALEKTDADPWLALVFRGAAENRTGSLREAWALHPEFPEPARELISLVPERERDLWMRRALAAQVDDPQAYEAYHLKLLPEWGGSAAKLRRFAEACRAAERPGVAVWYGSATAYRRRAEDVPAEKLFADDAVAAAMEETLAPHLSDPDDERYVRSLATALLGAVRYVRGDLDGAVAAYREGGDPGFRQVAWIAFDNWIRTTETLAALASPRGDLLMPLYRRAVAGEAVPAEEIEAAWTALGKASQDEAALLADVGFRSWRGAGYDAGRPYGIGMLRRRNFVDWVNYASGFSLEEGTDNGGGHTRDGARHWMRMVRPLPKDLEVAGMFEPWGDAAAPHVFGVYLGGAEHEKHGNPTVMFRREKERLGAWIEPAVGMARPEDGFYLDEDERAEETDADPARAPWVWRRLPEGWPARYRVVVSGGTVLVYLGDETEPVASSAEWAGTYSPENFPEDASLWVGGRNVRFLGVTLRKPSAEDAARAEALAAAFAEEAAKRAAETPSAAGAEEDDAENSYAICAAMARAHRMFLLGDREGELAASSNLLALATGPDGDREGEAAALNNIAWALHLTGRDAEALEPARRSVERMAATSNLDTLACILAALGETDEAKKKLVDAFQRLEMERVLSRSPGRRGKKSAAGGGSPELLEKERHLQFHLAQVHDLAGETALAKAMLDNLRIADFVPLGEETAYDALADKLGAAPLAPEARERAAIRRVADLLAAAWKEGNALLCAGEDHVAALAAVHEAFASVDSSAVPDDVRAAVEAFVQLFDEGGAPVERASADTFDRDETLQKYLEDLTARYDRAGKDLMRAVRRHGVPDDVLRDAFGW